MVHSSHPPLFSVAQMPSICMPQLRNPLDTSNFNINARVRLQTERMRTTIEEDNPDEEENESDTEKDGDSFRTGTYGGRRLDCMVATH